MNFLQDYFMFRSRLMMNQDWRSMNDWSMNTMNAMYAVNDWWGWNKNEKEKNINKNKNAFIEYANFMIQSIQLIPIH